MVLVSAPGKVHLIGEHAVVYGHPAILAAIDKRIYVNAEKYSKVSLKDSRFNSSKEWELEDIRKTTARAKELWQECDSKKDFSMLLAWSKQNHYENYWKALIGTVLERTEASSGISLDIIKFEIPPGSGLGSSSAAAAAIAKAASEVYGKKLS